MSTEIVRGLRINAVELLRQPGAVRPVDVSVDGTELDVDHESLAGPVEVDVDLEALHDGIAVRGEIRAPWSSVCRRCLRHLEGLAVGDVEELYQVELTDDDAYPIENGQVDLAPMARQTALLELDDERLCRPDCAGLCPACGIDRNGATCDCDTTVKDDRWAALDGLVLDD